MSAGWVGRFRPPGWLAVLAVVVTAAAAGLVVVWVVDATASTRSVRAVVTLAEQTEVQTTDGTSYSYRIEARTEDGRALDLRPGEALAGGLSLAEPVVLRVSRATGDVVGVRSADEDVDLQFTTASVVGLVLAGVVLVSAATWARAIWRVWRPAVTGAVAGAALLTVGLVSLRGPGIAETRVLSDDVGMEIYTDPGFFPDRTAATGQTAQVGEFTVQVTGALTDRPPAGSPSWLRDFHVIVVPVKVAFLSDSARGYLPVKLIGQGRGRAQIVRAPACGGVTGAFDGDGTAEQLTTTGPMCFAALHPTGSASITTRCSSAASGVVSIVSLLASAGSARPAGGGG